MTCLRGMNTGFMGERVVLELMQCFLHNGTWKVIFYIYNTPEHVYRITRVSTSLKLHSVSFYRQPFRDLTGHLTQGHRMTPKWTCTLQGHMCPLYVLLVSTNPTVHSVSLYDHPFSRYKSFWDKCTEWPQISLEPYKVKLPYICIIGIPGSQISLRSVLRPAVLIYRPVWDKCTELPQNDLEHYNVKGTPHMCY